MKGYGIAMLQIISGKFYGGKDSYITECKMPLFSNVGTTQEIETKIFKIIPGSCSVTKGYTYIVEYNNMIQKPTGAASFAFVKVGDNEILNQIQVILSFATNGIFSSDQNYITTICRERTSSNSYNSVPSEFVEKTLSFRYLSSDEILMVAHFVDKMILLERKKYMAAVSCLKTYNASLKLLDDDVCLAYSMLVYCLESLSQKFDEYIPTWDDFDQNRKGKIEKLFKDLEVERVQNIKEVLVKDQHLKLSSRFIDFICINLDEDFFGKEAQNINNPIQKNELIVALKNTYYIRSGYVHELNRPIPQVLMASFSKNCDSFIYENVPYLTYNGLQRIVRKVIMNFVDLSAEVESEDYNWYDDLPNTLKARLDPNMWVHDERMVTKDNAETFYNGFLECFLKGEKSLPDMRRVIDVFQKNFDNNSEINKSSIYAIVKLYNAIIQESDRSEGYDQFLTKNYSISQKCNIINISLSLLPISFSQEEEIKLWDIEECENIVTLYLKQKCKSNRFRFKNKIIETIIFVAIASRFKDEDNREKYDYWMDMAYYNSSGDYQLQLNILEQKTKFDDVDISLIYQKLFDRQDNKQ